MGEIQLPVGVLTKENLIELRSLVGKKDEKKFRKRMDSYLERLVAANPGREKGEMRNLALSYLGSLALIADRGYLTLGIPYPPAPVGPVERQFLKLYDKKNYLLLKKRKWMMENYR